MGEVYLLSTEAVATYYGHGDELHLAFNFPPLFARWRTGRVDRSASKRRWPRWSPADAWPTWVLSNHDNPRHRTRYDRAGARRGEDQATTARRSEARARAAAVLLLTLRGTPFLYQGEELGLLDGVVPPERRVDPGGRDGCRSPVPWDGTPDHGWPTVGGCRGVAALPSGAPTAGTGSTRKRTPPPSSTCTAGSSASATPAAPSRSER